MKPILGKPAGAVPTGDRIELSSETGNKHVIRGQAFKSGEMQYIMLDEPTPIEHPEHETLVIPEGYYEVSTVRSYIPVVNMD